MAHILVINLYFNQRLNSFKYTLLRSFTSSPPLAISGVKLLIALPLSRIVKMRNGRLSLAAALKISAKCPFWDPHPPLLRQN
jgi:hypothetical protein